MSTAAMPAPDNNRDLLELTEQAVGDLDRLLDVAARHVREKVIVDGRVSSAAMEQEQRAAHGLAWLATYVASFRQLHNYAARLTDSGAFGELEELLVRLGFAEYLAQTFGGIPMNQGEIVRLPDLGLTEQEIERAKTAAVNDLIASGNTPEIRRRIAGLIRHKAGESIFGASGLDETMEQIRNEMRRFAEDNVAPYAHEWHLENAYIPLEVVTQMAELGVFGLTIPEEYGGLGLGKEAMCVVSEELSRAYIGVGSLGTRSEIAAELILCGGTEEQKQKWLPKIASGETLPTDRKSVV